MIMSSAEYVRRKRVYTPVNSNAECS